MGVKLSFDFSHERKTGSSVKVESIRHDIIDDINGVIARTESTLQSEKSCQLRAFIYYLCIMNWFIEIKKYLVYNLNI